MLPLLLRGLAGLFQTLRLHLPFPLALCFLSSDFCNTGTPVGRAEPLLCVIADRANAGSLIAGWPAGPAPCGLFPPGVSFPVWSSVYSSSDCGLAPPHVPSSPGSPVASTKTVRPGSRTPWACREPGLGFGRPPCCSAPGTGRLHLGPYLRCPPSSSQALFCLRLRHSLSRVRVFLFF